MKSNPKFKVGDVIIKVYGKKPAKITQLCSWYGTDYVCKYLHSNSTIYVKESDIKLYEEETMAVTNTLYTFNEGTETIYASVIGKTESGMLVLEAKGKGGIYTKSPDDVTEVIPYTVEISFESSRKESIHYESTKGVLQKGDVVINDNGNFGIVKAVDTKCKTARAPFKGRKVLTEKI